MVEVQYFYRCTCTCTDSQAEMGCAADLACQRCPYPNRTIDSTINSDYDRTMSALTANDLKTRGVAAIEATLAGQPEAVISVRGKDRFVVMEVAQYHYLRECELDAALAQSRADEAAGRYVAESAQAHMARLD